MLNFVKQVFFLLSAEGSLVDIRAYVALHLGGTPSQETGTIPPSCLLLDNRLLMLCKFQGMEVKVDQKDCNSSVRPVHAQGFCPLFFVQ